MQMGSNRKSEARKCHHDALHGAIGGSKGGASDAPPPVQTFSFSCSFWGNLGKIIGWRPVPPPLGNPASATESPGMKSKSLYICSLAR